MYESHYGLERRAFAETTDPGTYVGLNSHDVVLRRLRYAFEQGCGPAILFGTAGSGKTILTRRLAIELSGPVVHVTYPMMPTSELIAHLAAEFGNTGEIPHLLNESLRVLRTRLSALTASGHSPLLVVDEAHLIEEIATFESLRLLQNFTTGGSPDLALLLVGGAELALDLPASLVDRLAARCLLGPLTESESSAYIVGRLQTAGSARSAEIFDPDARRALHRWGQGLPRRINRLADLALLIGYAREETVIDERTIMLAARELMPESTAA